MSFKGKIETEYQKDCAKDEKLKLTKVRRANETEISRQMRLEKQRNRAKLLLSKETEEERQNRLEKRREKYNKRMTAETKEKRQSRLQHQKEHDKLRRANETDDQRHVRHKVLRQRERLQRLKETEEDHHVRLKSLRERRCIEDKEKRQIRLNYLKYHGKIRRTNENEEERTDRLRYLKEHEKLRRSNETEGNREKRLQILKERETLRRSNENEEDRQARLHYVKEYEQQLRSKETEEKRRRRLQYLREIEKLHHSNETEKERQTRLHYLKEHAKLRRSNEFKTERQTRLHELKEHVKIYRFNETEENRKFRLQNLKKRRNNETEEERKLRLQSLRAREKKRRCIEAREKQKCRLQILSDQIKNRIANQTIEQRLARLQHLKLLNTQRVASKSESKILFRLQGLRDCNNLRLENQTEEERQRRIQDLKQKIKNSLKNICRHNLLQPAVTFNNTMSEEQRQDGQNLESIKLVKHKKRTRCMAVCPEIEEEFILEHYCGKMNFQCNHCNAVSFASEGVYIKSNEEHEFSLCCHKGKVVLQPLQEFPEAPKELMIGVSESSNNFRSNIRQFNSAFACASFGADIIVPPGFGKYCFKIQGQIYYRTGPLKPNDTDTPSFGQVYVLDPEQADAIRCNHPCNTECDMNVMSLLDRLFREINPYAQSWRMMKEVLDEEERHANARGEAPRQVDMVIMENVLLDSRRYNAQRANEVAMVFVSKDGIPPFDRAFIAVPITTNNKKYLSFMNPNLDPMLYPILFPRGDLGWHNQIMQWDPVTQRHSKRRVTQMQFYSYRLATRLNDKGDIDFNPLLNAGKLTQQYVVDAYTKVEANRLKWIRDHQIELRVENYKLLEDHLVNSANAENIPIGKPVILPSSFQNGPRALTQHFQDAMAIVAQYGKPDIFITFTCNPNWKEISENLGNQTSENRPDLIARVFHLKLKDLIKDLTENMVLGTVVAFVYTIEFQKRGLPHAHILLILDTDDKIRDTKKINQTVSAEIPNKRLCPKLYDTVTAHMLHGPCGVDFPKSPCMEQINEYVFNEAGQPTCDEDGKLITTLKWKCTKNFPKDFQETTLENFNGYPLYRRRRKGETFTKIKQGNEVVMDNRNVVPYNPYLSLKYNAHINVEICSSVKAVKYIFKYIYKGHDCANVEIGIDEIKTYLDCRYVSAPEAMWRLCGYQMHQHSHAIYRLPVHLDGQQPIYFQEGEEAEAIERFGNRLTKLTAWFKLNADDVSAKQYLYTDIPYHYTWHPKETVWKKRKRKHRLISRMYTVSPSDLERYHLRLLLLHVKGAESYQDLKTVILEDKVFICKSFQEACQKLGLLDDDSEWENCLRECSEFQMPKQLRKLFAYILVFCQPSEPLNLWHNYREKMMEDYIIFHEQQPEVALNMTLLEIKKVLNISHKELSDFGIPEPDTNVMAVTIDNSVIERHDSERRIAMLNDDQKHAFTSIINAIDDDSVPQRLFYLDGPGGSGKTFLYNTILSFLRCRGEIVFPIAWTGIASTLLVGGQTVHSCFGLPVPINETSACIRNKYFKPSGVVSKVKKLFDGQFRNRT